MYPLNAPSAPMGTLIMFSNVDWKICYYFLATFLQRIKVKMQFCDKLNLEKLFWMSLCRVVQGIESLGKTVVGEFCVK